MPGTHSSSQKRAPTEEDLPKSLYDCGQDLFLAGPHFCPWTMGMMITTRRKIVRLKEDPDLHLGEAKWAVPGTGVVLQLQK